MSAETRDDGAPWINDMLGRVDELIGEYRGRLHDCLDGLNEDEVRARLVPSSTTLLGLVKHVTFVEGLVRPGELWSALSHREVPLTAPVRDPAPASREPASRAIPVLGGPPAWPRAGSSREPERDTALD